MKTITKSSIIAATVAVIATSAFADDQQLQNRLAIQRQQSERNGRNMTVAIFTGDRGGRVARDARREARYEARSNAHSQTYGAYVAVR